MWNSARRTGPSEVYNTSNELNVSKSTFHITKRNNSENLFFVEIVIRWWKDKNSWSTKTVQRKTKSKFNVNVFIWFWIVVCGPFSTSVTNHFANSDALDDFYRIFCSSTQYLLIYFVRIRFCVAFYFWVCLHFGYRVLLLFVPFKKHLDALIKYKNHFHFELIYRISVFGKRGVVLYDKRENIHKISISWYWASFHQIE